jgi:hypothetical protein
MKSGTSLQARPRATVGPPIENANNAELMNAERALCQAAARASSHIFNVYIMSYSLPHAMQHTIALRSASGLGTLSALRRAPQNNCRPVVFSVCRSQLSVPNKFHTSVSSWLPAQYFSV